MDIIVRLFMGAGLILMIYGGILHTIAIFRFSRKWGLLCTFVPFAYIVFLLRHFHVVKKALHKELIGFGLLVFGMVLHSM